MNRIARAALILGTLVSSAATQPIPVYKTQEDYCYHKPDMPTCKDGKPMEMYDWSKGVQLQPKVDLDFLNKPKSTTSTKPSTSIVTAPVSAPSSTVSGPPLTVPQARRKRGAAGDVRLGEIDWRLLQPEADMLIGLNMAGLAQSDLARTLIGQWVGKLGASAEEQKRLVAALADIPQAVISIHRKEIVAVLNGRTESFPEQALIGGLQTMRVSADTVVLGSPTAVRWAVWRLNFAPNPNADVLEAQALARTNDFWVLGKPQALAAFGQKVNPGAPLSKIKMGVSFKDSFRMDMFLEMADPAAAAKILETSMRGAPREMKAGVEGNAVHYALVIDRDTALQRFAGFMTDPMGKQFAPLLAAARQIAARNNSATRAAPGKIVIDGLEDGPREVSVAPRQP